MSTPGDEELESAATRALLPNIEKIQTFFELARAMEQVSLVNTSNMTPCVPQMNLVRKATAAVVYLYIGALIVLWCLALLACPIPSCPADDAHPAE